MPLTVKVKKPSKKRVMPAAKIEVKLEKGLRFFEVTYRKKVVGNFLNRDLAVKLANGYEVWASTGYVHRWKQ